MPYSPMLVRPMREELTSAGVKELTTAAEVDAWLAEKNGTAMLIVNSVCGCAAGAARPGARLALQSPDRPDRVARCSGAGPRSHGEGSRRVPDIPP